MSNYEPAKLRVIAGEILAWRLERDPQLRLIKGLSAKSLPRIDPAAAHEVAEFARRMRTRLEAIDSGGLTHSDELLRQSLVHETRSEADKERFYRLVFVVTP